MSRALASILAALLLQAAPAHAGAIGEMGSYSAAHEDTLMDISRRFNLGFVELRAANPEVDVWLPGDGTEVLLPSWHLLPNAPHEGIVINLSEMRLYHFPKNGGPVETFPIGIGRDGRLTPVGSTTVVRKLSDPTWYPPESIRKEKPELPSVVPPGPENPLGRHALYLGWQSYLIHGTNQPDGVGRRISAGCIRMYPEDIERLFATVDPSTPVTVVDQPVKLAWIDGELYMEVHPNQEQADQIEMDGAFDLKLPKNVIGQVIEVAGEDSKRLNWRAIENAAVERRGYPLRITR
jgi:L,D-transpeptidase ErfK/SrfK